MSEYLPVVNQKRYLILADDLHMSLLAKLNPGLLFLEVQGLHLENNPGHIFLVNPVNKPEAPLLKPEEPPLEGV